MGMDTPDDVAVDNARGGDTGAGPTIEDNAPLQPVELFSRSSNGFTDDSQKPKSSPSSRIHYRREYTNIGGGVVFSQELQPQDIASSDSPYAIVVTESWRTQQDKDAYRPEDERGLPPAALSANATKIEIKSQAVIHAFRSIIGYYPSLLLTGDVVSLHEPYAPLYHYRRELQEYSESFSTRDGQTEHCQEDHKLTGDVKLLLDYFEDKWGQRVKDELERYKKPKPTCTFDMLWMLFKPGIDVYVDRHTNKMYQAYVFRSLDFDYTDGRVSVYATRFWCLQGNNIAIDIPMPEETMIFPWSGEMEIAKLNVFPCEYMRKEEHGTTDEERREALVKRGELYFRLLKGPNFVTFNGHDADMPRAPYRGRAMVDMHRHSIDVSTVQFHGVEHSGQIASRCSCSACTERAAVWEARRMQFASYQDLATSKVDTLTKHQYLLCKCYLPAYILKYRAWKNLEMEGFDWPQFKSNLIHTLVVPPSTRDLLQSLCQKFTSETTWSADFIEGKGEGSIVLLHGEPGVGKTYTAECVAEHTQKPLISLTTADIGTDPATVERSLLYFFKLAKAWGAILLLDEADVFLERRSATDLVQNNMVAIFLRTLEYYQGILFLTTNRIGTFDEAFLSRIDVPIYFPPLTDDQRAAIWGTFFAKLEKERQGKIRVSSDVRYYVKEDRDLLGLLWNGREIRSGFQTAVALAEIEGAGRGETEITVTQNHISKVVDMAKDFKNYLKELYQKNQADLAASMGLRYDLSQRASRQSGPDRAF